MAYKQQRVILTILEAGSPGLGSQVRALFQVADFLLFPHVAEEARKLSQASFYKGVYSIHGGSVSMSQEPQLQMLLPWALGFQHMNVGGGGVEGIQTFRPQHWIRKISSFQSL